MRFTLLDGLRGVAAIAVVILHSISPLELENNTFLMLTWQSIFSSRSVGS